MKPTRRLLTVLAVSTAALALVPATPAKAKVEGDTIVFGAAVSLSGKYSTDGQHTKRGYDMAVDYINKAGGIKVGGKAYKISIKYYDDESNTARAADLAERLIKQDGIKYILGPYSSGITQAVAPVTEKNKIPMVEGNGAARALFTKGYRYIFALLSTADQYLSEAINLAAEHAKAEGKDPASVKVAMAFENDSFSQDVRLGVVEQAKKYGMKIVIDDKLPPEINDMAATLNKVRALKPDLLVVSGHGKGAALAVTQMAQMKVSVPMLAMTHCESAQVTDEKKYGKNAENALCATQWDENLSYKDEIFGTAKKYYDDFTKIYGYNPPYQAAESTATVFVYSRAIEKAGSFDTEKVRDAIAATKMPTFYGNVDFDETGKNVGKPMVLRQIQGGRYVPVAPTKYATGKFKAGM